MFSRIVLKMKYAIGRFGGMFGPRAAILLYHRVTDADSDPYLMRVTLKHFEQQLQVIQDLSHPMHLDDMVTGLYNGKLPDRAICVTFDDGYADNLQYAKPLLEQYDVPATIFMTTGTAGRDREFWWDELERVFLQPGELPERLQMDVDGNALDIHFGEAATYTHEDVRRDQEWSLLVPDDPVPPIDPTPRHTAVRTLDRLLERMGSMKQKDVLDRLLAWAGQYPVVRSSHRAVSVDEMVDLEHGGIIRLGAHTASHLDLSRQPAQVQEQEIGQSKDDLERYIGHSVKSFSYPFGAYCHESVDLVRQAGFEYACGACRLQTVRRNSERYLLPRMDAFNWSRDNFAHRLKWQLGI